MVLGLIAIFFHKAITVHNVLGVLFIIPGLLSGAADEDLPELRASV